MVDPANASLAKIIRESLGARPNPPATRERSKVSWRDRSSDRPRSDVFSKVISNTPQESGTVTDVNIQRAAMKSYGVRSRVKWDDSKGYNEAYKIKGPEGEYWCDNVVQWFIYKVPNPVFEPDG